MNPDTKDTVRAKIERLLSPGLGTCGRCLRPWRFPKQVQVAPRVWMQTNRDRFWGLVGVKNHSTSYSCGSGLFPLCESCWSSLTPTTRMPYYESLIDLWEEQGTNVEAIRTQVRIAVMSGL